MQYALHYAAQCSKNYSAPSISVYCSALQCSMFGFYEKKKMLESPGQPCHEVEAYCIKNSEELKFIFISFLKGLYRQI
jgi:hypothetical protein